MSDLVFVRDAQGRPLMPMSAAYARTLVNQGKAQVWPHPAFSVIQLTRVVDTPTLRPVLVGLALSTTIADIVIVVEQVRSAPSTVQVAVDLGAPPSLRRMHDARREPRRRRILPAQAGTFQRPRDRVHLLAAVLKLWQEVIPISHLVLLPSARTTALTPPSARWIEQQIIARVRRLVRTIAIVHRHTKLAGEAPYTLMQHLMEKTIWAARQSPQFVACAAVTHPRFHHERRYPSHRRWEQRNQAAQHVTPDLHLRHLGQLCTVRFQRRTLIGVLQTVRPPDHLVLRVPSEVDDQGVQWQLTHVPCIPSLHVWPATPIWLLPLPRKERGDSNQG
jgi:hypothetical protein